MTYTIEPIIDQTWIGQKPKRSSQFDTPWHKTLAHLEKEIDHLGGDSFVLQMAVSASDLKLNGELRANARPWSDAVVVSFDSKHGPLTYRCDQYAVWSVARQGPAWQHNVRAIALTLESLRAVDRYGATTGEQYAGFKALGAGRAMPASSMTLTEARDLLLTTAYGEDSVNREDYPWHLVDTHDLVHQAKIKAHPDKREGDHTLWHKVEEAERLVLR